MFFEVQIPDKLKLTLNCFIEISIKYILQLFNLNIHQFYILNF